MALVTRDSIKRYLDIDTNDASKDVMLDEWLAEATAWVESECNQPIESRALTAWPFDGNGFTTMHPPFLSVRSATALQYRGGDGSDATWTTIATTEWELVAPNAGTPAASAPYLYYPPGFGRGVANYRVTLGVGYATIPGDIQRVVREYVSMIFLESPGAGNGNRFGVSSITRSTQNGGSVTTAFKATDLEERWRKMLARYRVPTMGGPRSGAWNLYERNVNLGV